MLPNTPMRGERDGESDDDAEDVALRAKTAAVSKARGADAARFFKSRVPEVVPQPRALDEEVAGAAAAAAAATPAPSSPVVAVVTKAAGAVAAVVNAVTNMGSAGADDDDDDESSDDEEGGVPVDDGLVLMVTPDSALAGDEVADRWGVIHSLAPAKGPQAVAAAVAELQARDGGRGGLRKEQQREVKWVDMLARLSAVERKRLFKRRVRKGIPDSMRARIWPLLLRADERRRAFAADYYEQLLRAPVADDGSSSSSSSGATAAVSAEIDTQIQKDLNRTYPSHIMFRRRPEDEVDARVRDPDSGELRYKAKGPRAQLALYRVCRAYAAHDADLGYCQGMGMVAGLFLMYVPEAEAFWMLERFLAAERYGPFRGVYAVGFPRMMVFLAQHDALLRRTAPRLAAHLTALGVQATVYAFRWYSTVFDRFPRAFVVRVWDALLHEGCKVLFRVALALLVANKRRLLAATQWDEVMTLLQDLPRSSAAPLLAPGDDQPWLPLDTHEGINALFKIAFSLRVKRAHLDAAERALRT